MFQYFVNTFQTSIRFIMKCFFLRATWKLNNNDWPTWFKKKNNRQSKYFLYSKSGLFICRDLTCLTTNVLQPVVRDWLVVIGLISNYPLGLWCTYRSLTIQQCSRVGYITMNDTPSTMKVLYTVSRNLAKILPPFYKNFV